MASKGQSVQAVFLDHVRDHHVPVSIFLINGVKLQGVVVGHDAFTVQLIFRGQAQSIYKRAISTISPDRPIQLWDAAAGQDHP
ncbi:MAG TPA: RNA chaperone Hfq [Stellaceae bacterium]|jgi:host factor-I protein